MKNGSFIISLDFELFWGLRDLKNANDYKESIIGAKKVIPRIIELFNKYDVKATFAIVGFLLCNSKEDIYRYSPLKKPSYKDKDLSSYEDDYIDNLSMNDYDLHFASDIVEHLKSQPNIEIGTHTFCHYYCTAEGQTIDEFEDDLKSAISIANDHGICLLSIVFPRNEVSDEYIKVCAKYNIKNYRGNPKKYFNNKSFVNKIMRFWDTYFNLNNQTTYNYNETKQGGMYNIKASRFLRPYSKRFSFMENLKIKRIKNEMENAAVNNQVYHLWWHPHNFGINIDKNLSLLEEILLHYTFLKKKYRMNSFTMNELAEKLRENGE